MPTTSVGLKSRRIAATGVGSPAARATAAPSAASSSLGSIAPLAATSPGRRAMATTGRDGADFGPFGGPGRNASAARARGEDKAAPAASPPSIRRREFSRLMGAPRTPGP